MKRTLVAILIALLFVPILPMIAESSINDNLAEQEVPELSVEKSNSSFTPIPSPQNNSRLKQTYSLFSNSDSSQQENPDIYAYEYTDGKIVAMFKDGFQTNGGNIISKSIRTWSYPEQGTTGILDLDMMDQELQINLHNNFTHFKSCKPYIHNFEIFVFCEGYNSADAHLDLGNNITVSIKTDQDMLVQWNQTGHVLSHWIPQTNASNKVDASVDYIWNAQFLDDSIFMLMSTPSSESINFPNGSVDCASAFAYYCNILAKVNLNGTVENYLKIKFRMVSQVF